MKSKKTKDVEILQKLATQKAEIAADPIQKETKQLWRKLNARSPERPMVKIDQVCWHEMNVNNELTLQCEDPECRWYEDYLRRILFQWHHFPVDMVVEPYVPVPLAVHNTGFGISVHEETATSDSASGVKSHLYENQFHSEEDVKKIQTPQVTHDAEETERRLSVAHKLFDGILEVKPEGVEPYLSLWDPLATWMGVENAYLELVENPQLIHSILSRMTEGYIKMLDQLEEKGLLCGPQTLIHCTGAYTDELPAAGYDPKQPRTQDIWMFGLAQMLGSVSPDMFREFEIDYMTPICRRFGLVYYGCCEPLHGKMKEVRMIPNLRKISMSPWVNQESGAEQIGNDYVFSRKPNPVLVGTSTFDPEKIRSELIRTRDICLSNGCPLEFILKDISTVQYHPERLFEWAEIAMEVAKD